MLALKNGEYIIVKNDDLDISDYIDLDLYKIEKLNDISEKRDFLIEDGFTLNDVKYGFNKVDQQNMIETLTLLNTKLLSGDTNPEIYYKPYGVGLMKKYAVNEFMEVVGAAAEHKTSIWNKYNSLVIAISEAKSIEEIDEIEMIV